MKTVNRRRFLQVGTAGAAALGWTAPLASAQSADRIGSSPDDWVVRLSGDGLGLTSPQYSRLLVQLAEERGIQIDNYSVGGVIDQLEKEFARVLGKERAVFMPTGTLANNIAVRALAGGPSRVIVQEESHLYQDEGDCAQTLSNLTLIPLAAGPIPRGTNLFRLKVRAPDAVLFQKRLATRGVILAPPLGSSRPLLGSSEREALEALLQSAGGHVRGGGERDDRSDARRRARRPIGVRGRGLTPRLERALPPTGRLRNEACHA